MRQEGRWANGIDGASEWRAETTGDPKRKGKSKKTEDERTSECQTKICGELGHGRLAECENCKTAKGDLEGSRLERKMGEKWGKWDTRKGPRSKKDQEAENIRVWPRRILGSDGETGSTRDGIREK